MHTDLRLARTCSLLRSAQIELSEVIRAAFTKTPPSVKQSAGPDKNKLRSLALRNALRGVFGGVARRRICAQASAGR